jgi:lysozyme family protein
MADYSDKFLKAVNHLLIEEGGYSNASGDHGGETNFGISKASYPDLDIANLTRDDAITIYFRDFWTPNNYERIPNDEVAIKALSLAANCGRKPANECLQRAMDRIWPAKVQIDGVVGDDTIRWLSMMLRGNQIVAGAAMADYLLCAFELEAIKYHVGLKQKQWVTGWVLRDLD